MTARVNIFEGNIFEGGADLTVLPASAKGTISSSCRRWVEIYKLESPPFDKGSALGGLSDCFPFQDKSLSSYYCYAYSVFNNNSSAEAITDIAQKLGELSKKNEAIRMIQAPLLGTGAGRLKDDVAAKALISGFAETCHPDAQLFISVYGAERHQELQKLLKGFGQRLKDAIQLKLTFLGAGIDFKKLKK